MSREHHARVKELFLAARQQPPSLREEYLAAHCGGDDALQQEVESLLSRLRDIEAASPATTDLRSRGDDSATADYPGHSEVNLRVPNYRVLQKIGEGGMGEVYEAEQQSPVKRRVALKVLKGGLATREVVARFESERQALAMMNHPSIAQVFEAGATERESPFFAMELVHGEPITRYCDRHRLTNRERLDLFEKVCAGVQHAHQKGIIHRDLKPSNILVTVADEEPVPKIIDFGIAKAINQPLTESTHFTQIGQWIGTPEYMSPEQAEMSSLDIDTRSDVYSLGVLLYELLAGARPFDSSELRQAGLDEMRRRIREEEPTRPSLKVSGLGEDSQPAAHDRQTNVDSLVLQLRGDLDWITMKALEKDRTRRYSSPSELSADIRRHLNDEPVSACPPSGLYRARKFMRRNRLVVIAAGLVTGAILLGLATTSLALLHARDEARRATQVAVFLEDMIGDFNPFLQTSAVTLDNRLEQAVNRLETELDDQKLVQARLLRRIGMTYRDIGRFERAEALLERSLDTFKAEFGRDHHETADCIRELAWLAWEVGDYPKHERFITDYRDILLRIADSDDPRVGVAETDIAFSAWAMGHYERSAELFSRALTRLESAAEPSQLDIARNLQLQGVLYNSSGDYRRGRVAAERSLRIRTALLGPDNLHTAWSLRILARTQRLQGDYQQALESAQRSLDVMEKRLGPDHSDLAFSLSTLGLTHSDLGDFDSGKPLLERALALRESALGPEHGEVGLSLIKLAGLHLDAGDPEAAGPLIERALTIGRNAFPPGHPQIAWRIHALSRQRHLCGQLEEALALQRQALTMVESASGPDDPVLAPHLANLGSLLRDQGSLDEARGLLRRALALRERQLGPRHQRIADDRFELGRLHALSGEIGLAEEEIQSALAMYRETVGDEHPAVDRCLLALETLPARSIPSR